MMCSFEVPKCLPNGRLKKREEIYTYIYTYFSEMKLTVNHEKQSNELYLLVWAVGHSGGLLGGETHLVQTQVCHMGRH
jgi:hypothetical protein